MASTLLQHSATAIWAKVLVALDRTALQDPVGLTQP